MKLQAATRLKASLLEERVFEYVRHNFSLEDHDVKFSDVKAGAVGQFNQAEMVSPDFYRGTYRAMEALYMELQGLGITPHEFVSNR